MPQKHRISSSNVGIPQRPTANIGITLRKELESTPEVFDNVATVVTTQAGSSLSSDALLPVITQPENLEDITQEEITKKKNSKRKNNGISKSKPEITVQITEDEEIYDHESEFLQNFTESTGTYSYDSPFSVESFSEFLDKGKLVESTPVECLKAEVLVTEPTIKCKKAISTRIEALDQQRFMELITSEKAPQFGKFEAISAKKLKALQHQSFVQQIIGKAVADFFEAPRDDLILNVKIRRQGLHPILNVQLQQSFGKANKTSKNRQTTDNTLVLYEDEDVDNEDAIQCKIKHKHNLDCGFKGSPRRSKSSKNGSTKNSANFFNSAYNYFNTLFKFKENNSPIYDDKEKSQTKTSSTSTISISNANAFVDNNWSTASESDSSILSLDKTKKKLSGRKKKS